MRAGVAGYVRDIAPEVTDRFTVDIAEQPPIVQIVAPKDWWRGWLDMGFRTRKAAGCWERAFIDLTAQLEVALGILVECVSHQGISQADIRWDEFGPCLVQQPPLRYLRLDG